MCASINNASIRWHYGAAWGGWPESLLQKLEMPELLVKWPRKVLHLGEIVGSMTEEAASHLGLRSGIPVAQGGTSAPSLRGH